jgi:phage replication-related protein YjqB (UPF0714/DUF867 family)
MKSILLFSLLWAGPLYGLDQYTNFAELAAHERDGVDYRIDVQPRAHSISILAIHGGAIEPGTSGLARAIAGDDYNLYLFEGLKSQRNWDLHLTSTAFDEPAALALVDASQLCVTVHAFIGDQNNICLGGLNSRLQQAIFRSVLSTGLISQQSANPCERFYAKSESNIVNRCQNQGVQIEVSTTLMDELRRSPDKHQIFAKAVRKALSAQSCEQELFH